MAEIHFDNWMSDSDALMWTIERDPRLRSTIMSVMLLDQAPDQARFRASIERMVKAIPRLRQRVVEDSFGLAPPSWETDPNFDYHYHVRNITVSSADADGDLQGLLNVASTAAVQAFDKDRPLWEYYLVHGLSGGRTGILMKLHHAISDGVGLVKMSRYFLDMEPNPPQAPDLLRESHDAPVRTPMTRLFDAARHRTQRNFGMLFGANRLALAGAGKLLRDPAGSLGKAREAMASVRRLTRNDGAPLSPVMLDRSLSSNFRVLSVPLAEIKAAAKAGKGTVNDAFVAVVAGGLARYHRFHGRPVPALRMQMPVNVRDLGKDAEKVGNQFVPVRLEVPTNIADPVQRMQQIRERVAEQLGEPALGLFNEISGVLAQLPDSLAIKVSSGMAGSVDFTTSNVPGIPVPVYVSGARVREQYGFGPIAGAALNVTATSYAGEFTMSLNLDRSAVPDPDQLQACMQAALEEVLALAPVAAAAASTA